MFMFTVRPTVKKVIVTACIILVAILITAFSFTGIKLDKDISTGAEVEETAQDGIDNTSRIAYLNNLGWKVSSEPIEICDVQIPSEFNKTFKDFNDIQKTQGYDLSNYKGIICKRYTYEVNNYPDKSDNVYADLLVLDGNIIGGDICSNEFTGFINSLSYPS